MGAASPDMAMQSKRMRSLETEVLGLRQQLDDEREEKAFLYSRLRELEGGGAGNGSGKGPYPHEQAGYSHLRLKAKTLRSQLDQ